MSEELRPEDLLPEGIGLRDLFELAHVAHEGATINIPEDDPHFVREMVMNAWETAPPDIIEHVELDRFTSIFHFALDMGVAYERKRKNR